MLWAFLCTRPWRIGFGLELIWIFNGLLLLFCFYLGWQNIRQLYNLVRRLNIDSQGLHIKTAKGQEQIAWQELSKVEKHFMAVNSKVPRFYELTLKNGRRIFLPGEMDSSGSLIAQVKSLSSEAGVSPSFVLPERFVMPLRNRLLIALALLALVGIYFSIEFDFQSKSKGINREYSFGYIDKAGKLKIPVKFDEAENFSKYGATVKVKGKESTINKGGEPILPFDDLDAGDGLSGLIRASSQNKAVFIDSQGKQIIKTKFDAATGFYDGIAYVQIGKKWGSINETGRFIIKPTFDDCPVSSGKDGRLFELLKGKVVCVDRTGKILFKTLFDSIGEFSEGIAAVALNDKLGFIDQNGKTICKPKYDLVGDFHEGLAWVNLGLNPNSPEEGRYGYVDRTGQLVIPIKFASHNDFSGGLAAVVLPYRKGDLFPRFNNWGYIDHKGNYIVKPELGYASDLQEGLAAIEDDNSQWGYLNNTGSIVIKPIFDYAENFSEGLAAVQVKDKFGYIDKSGQFVIPPTFDQAQSFSQGMAAVGFVKAVAAKQN